MRQLPPSGFPQRMGISLALVLAAVVMAGAWPARAQNQAAVAAPAVFPSPASPDAGIKRVEATIAKGPYKPEWDSLKRHKDPEWFRDAKFGIYTHWGPVTVATESAPTDMEWYGREMYLPEHPAFAYHKEHFGDQKTVGFKDVTLRFKAENFNADEWADLFVRAGAKFAGPVAIHHDSFANWDSKVTRWNSMAIGPHRDITGELEKAIRKRGLKFMTSFHHGFGWRYYEPAYKYDAADPQYADLYGEPHDPKDPPSRRYQDIWLALVDEVLVKYQPDLIWFDFELGAVITPEYQRKMFATAYNWAAANGREIGVTHKHTEIHQYTGILDYERGREDRLAPYVWLTDTSVGPWFWHSRLPLRPAGELVDILVDIVSKNGCLLLNVGPTADGGIPEPSKRILLAMGDWLKVNGEAIYGTRPWKVFGEGPTRNSGGGFSEQQDKAFTASDIRYTTKGDALYAIALAWPERAFTLHCVQVDSAGPEARVALLGAGPVEYSVNAEKQLVIKPPALAAAQRPCDFAYAFKLTGFKTSLHPAGRFEMPGVIRLEPGKATLEGNLCPQVNEGRANLGCWDAAGDRVHWLARVVTPGRYTVRGEFSSAYGDSGLKVSVDGQNLSAAVPETDGWFAPRFVSFGEFQFEKPGVYHLVLEPRDPASWRAVNVYGLQLAPLE